jgi:DNA-binding NtrC family response regulator
LQTRILIVDDEKPLAETLGEIFRVAGYDCRVAYDGAQAIECVRTFDPALMIADVIMPGMNGIELAKVVLDSRPNCAVLLYSGNAATQELLESAHGTGHDFRVLAKPTPPRQLLETVAQMLENRAALNTQSSRITRKKAVNQS